MIAFTDDHRQAYGVEPICRVLPIAPSTYHAHLARRADPSRLPDRARRDADLKVEIRRVFEENFRVYGVRKVWRQLRREGFSAARCTVARLMRDMGLRGAIRGKPLRTTISDKAAPCPLDRVNRQFHASAPDRLWLADFTYVATWTGFVYVAFVIDAYARRIVGWRASRTAHADFVLDALEQAPASGTHRLHPAGRSRGALLRHAERPSHGRVTQTIWPPAMPERFTSNRMLLFSSGSPVASKMCLSAASLWRRRSTATNQERKRRPGFKQGRMHGEID